MQKLNPSFPSGSFLVSLVMAAAFVTTSVAAPPTHIWSKRFGEQNDDFSQGIAVDGAGNVFMIAQFHGTVNFGGSDFSSPSFHTLALVKYSAAGEHVWSRHLATEQASAIATDHDGSVYIAGSFGGSIDLGGGAMTSAGLFDIYVAKYGADGAHAWSRRFGGNYDDFPEALAVDSHGDVYLTGSFGYNFQPYEPPTVPSGGNIDLGSGILTSAGKSDMYLAKFNPAGGGVWSKRFGGTEDDFGSELGVDGFDNVILAGGFQKTVSFGGPPLNAGIWHANFIAKYDPLGVHTWSRLIPYQLRDIAVDSPGDVILAGHFENTINAGGGNLVSGGKWDIYLARLDALGSHVWSQRFGGLDSDDVSAVGVDGDHHILMTGMFYITVNVGGGNLPRVGAPDIYLASYDAAGAHRWSRSIGGTDYESVGEPVTHGDDFFIAGSMTLTADFGGGGLTSHGGDDIYLAKYSDESAVPVRISKFDARARSETVELTWDLWSDEGLDRFALYRADGPNALQKLVHGGAIESPRDSYLDTDVEAGHTYSYELVVTTLDGDIVRSQPATVSTPRLTALLSQNTPNPFRSGTSIAYTLGEASDVVVAVYDAAGRVVVRLNDGRRDAGSYRIDWDGRDSRGRDVSSGVYFYRLEGVRGAAPQKMVLTR